MFLRTILSSCIICFFNTAVLTQNCATPFSIKFDKREATSVDISWSDTNVAPLGWEIELIIKGQSRTGAPNLPIITEKNTKLTGLLPSTSYELYLRTVCASDRKSNWNVAIPFTTLVAIPSACQINIPLKDNGTETIILDVKETGILGKDIFLKSVDLIIEHDWPADLRIILESPQGQQLLLSGHNGTVTDDFGDVLSSDCSRFTTFAPDACENLKTSKPPYIGVFRPDGDIGEWVQDTLSKGKWKLIVFDRAFKDAGVIKYININFSRENCIVPTNFTISRTDINSITVEWDYKPPCNSAVINVKENGIAKDPITVPCNLGSYTFNNLLPNTEYEFSIASRCSFNTISQESCVVKASTSCEPISVSENFENFQRCSEGCSSACEWNGGLWYNAKDDSEQDWIIWRGKTDTENTGPSGDITETGKYIYIENNPALCGDNNPIVLQSNCMQILSNDSGCDISFYYNMYGIDINSLTLEISIDNGNNWEPLYTIKGNQGEQWRRATISLRQYNGQVGIFRFKGISGNGFLADIAIDQIEFYKTIPLAGDIVYYQDNDGDGFGNEAFSLKICSSISPSGYVLKAGDCDDTNPNIHPDATEIQCNNKDENCNGNEDDQPEFNPIIINHIIEPASCNGSTDGKITLNIAGGTAPYQVNWSNGRTGQILDNLSTGIYFATISDAGGCMLSSDFIQINALTNLNIIVTEMSQTSCKGKSDATIKIGHNLDHPPYTYIWSNGSTSQHLENIPEGNYAVTVTDQNNCFAVLSNINISSRPSVLVSIKNIRHPFCFGQNTGIIELFTINGTPPYTYLWNTGEVTDAITQLTQGLYSCTITDNNGCINEFSTEIKSPAEIDIKTISIEAVRCFGESNGSIKTNATGGKPPYTYLWNKLSERTDDIFNLEAGAYTLTVTDANGCKKNTPPILVTQPPLFEIEIDSFAPASCIKGKNGFIRLKTIGGNGTNNFVWSHTDQSTGQFSDLVSGNYNVTAFDIAGCKAGIPNIFIPFVNVALQVELELLADNKCFNESVAKIKANITGGKPNFDYNWSHGVQYISEFGKDTIHQLGPGLYQLTVTDAEGCVGAGNTIQIKAKEPYYYTINSLIDNKCSNDSSGIIMVSVSGGTKPIGINWNGGLYSGANLMELPNGTYTAQIIDAQDCRLDILPLQINSLSNISIKADIMNESSQKNDGKICLSMEGGFEPLQIVWSNGITNQNCIDRLNSGTYTVTITDDLGCQTIESYEVDFMSSTADENAKDDIIIYPTPATDYLNIQSDKKLIALHIYDINGRYIRSYTEVNDRIYIQDLLNGIYILQMNIAQKSYIFRLVKH